MNKIFSFWLFGISIILLGASLFLNISNTVITNESIVLVFVGILATFIVVGNYAQVTEIRNSTNKQIEDLELKTQEKIDDLNSLYVKGQESSIKIEKIQKDIKFNSAESYRLYAKTLYDKKIFRKSTQYLLESILLYLECEFEEEIGTKIQNAMLGTVIENLQPSNWNSETEINVDFDYQKYIEKVKDFPDNFTQKQNILDYLEKYLEE